MQKVLDFLKKNSSLIALIALGIAGGCCFLNYVGGFPNSFVPAVTHLIRMLFMLSVLGGMFVCILLKKENILKAFLPLIIAAWLFYYTFSFLSSASLAQDGFKGIQIAVGVFYFFVGLIFMGVMVLKILAKLLKPFLGNIANLVLIMSIPFFFILMILLIAMYAVLDYNWSSYFYAFFIFAMPIGITFAYLPYSESETEAIFAKKAKKEEAKEEPVEEPAPEKKEEHVEEEVKEETPEENKEEEIDPTIFDEAAAEDDK